MSDYQISEIERAEKEHDKHFFISVKFVGTKNESRFFNLTEEQIKKIKEVLKD
jgi:hypothetical protein